MDVVVREIATEIAISFAHSQYDTHTFPVGFITAPHHPSELECDASGETGLR